MALRAYKSWWQDARVPKRRGRVLTFETFLRTMDPHEGDKKYCNLGKKCEMRVGIEWKVGRVKWCGCEMLVK